MGQYYKVINLDKEEYLHAHTFRDGLKLMEFGASGAGTMNGLAVLLAEGNGRGGGDFHINETDPLAHLVGSWARDRIVLAGDYADNEPDTFDDEGNPENLYLKAEREFTDISPQVAGMLCRDPWVADKLIDDEDWNGERQAAVREHVPEEIIAAVRERKARRKDAEIKEKQKSLRPDFVISVGGSDD